MIWWALEERRKRLEKLRAETLAEGRAAGLAEGRAEGRNEVRRELAVKLTELTEMSEDDRMAEINRLIEEAQQTVNGGAPRG